MKLQNIDIKVVSASIKNNFEESISECFDKIKALSNNKKVLKISTFSKSESKNEFETQFTILYNKAKEQSWILAPVTLINQPTLINCNVTMEVWFYDTSKQDVKFDFLGFKNFSILNINHGEMIFGASAYCNKNFFDNVSSAFSDINAILTSNNLNFSNVVRQWNYMENITTINQIDNAQVQNYQLFNDIRSKYYTQVNFSNGYPAATGIGMNFGGMVIEIIAIKPNEKSKISKIDNPLQINAHSYSTGVLENNELKTIATKTTPKFERAKYLQSDTMNMIFVSGTASITGEKTVHIDNITEQTKTTLNNIVTLVSNENLKHNGVTTDNNLQIANYRVYIAKTTELEKIEAICKSFFENTPAIFVQADVCRNNLLIEIEANFLIL